MNCLVLMKPRKLTDEQEYSLAAEYLAGASIEALAKSYGCSDGTVQNALRRCKTPKRSRSDSSALRKVLTSEQEQDLAISYQQGSSLEALGAKFTCSPVTVRNMLLRLGVPRRSCGRPARPATPTKTCSSCRQDLPRKAFYNEGRRSSECRGCLSQKAADKYQHDPLHRQQKAASAGKWQAEHPRESRAKKRLLVSGWTQEQFDAAWAAQQGRCAICQVPMRGSGNSIDSVCADHDHKTGQTRGLLCRRCNLNLGIFEKYQGHFGQYLENHKGIR